MKFTQKVILAFIASILVIPTYGQELKAFKLRNGLSVFIWEDDTQSDVFGMVGVRTGSANDPDQYTGLAHYLEHVMFKGTQTIGALNWSEEEPLYKQIIQKYDEMANETDPVKKEAINKEINDLTVAAAKISVSNEFSNLIESMGGKGLNAATGFDMTFYHNSFPSYQINKWLEISSQRFINPVYRTFQTELETVYEEFNRGKDNNSNIQREFIMSKAFEGSPYSRSIIGLSEHLKNPRLSELINFYNDWYVPENMALIIVGNIKADQIKNRIASTFGKLAPNKVKERKTYTDIEFKGRTQHTAKIGNSPSVTLVYPGIPKGHKDEIPLKIALELLSNGSGTGTLDKLSIDGELTYGYAYLNSMKDQGRCMIQIMPLFDQAQRRFESNKSAEKKAQKAIQQIVDGEFEDWIIDAIKSGLCRDYDVSLESNQGKAYSLLNAFIDEKDLGEVLNYKEIIANTSNDDIKRVAKQYLGSDYMVLNIEKGKVNNKNEKVQKPGYKAIDVPSGEQSLYAQQFKTLPIGQSEADFMNFDDVQIKKLNDKSALYYTQNKINPVFSLVIRYGAGETKYPNLGLAADLMSNAGIMGNFNPQELKKELSKLNVSCNVSADDDYLTVIMRGYENYLPEACQLLTKQVLMPQLDDKQLDRLKNSIFGSRMQRKDNVQILANALKEYIQYGNNSSYINELTDKAIYELNISTLTGDINRAANYEAKIYYTGSIPFEEVSTILSSNLPLVANEKPSESPNIKPFSELTENTVYFLPNTDAEQAQIFFFMPTANYNKNEDVLRDGFYQYFSGGFNGLVLNELREKRSMVYTAYGAISTPSLPDYPTAFVGQIGTQNDKAVEALNLYMDLLRNMPQNPDRMNNIKDYMKQEALTSKPNFRNKAYQIEYYKRMGYDQDPAIENVPKIESLTFDDIMEYYNQNIKDKPIAIGVMGNPKDINIEDLKKYGKVIKLSNNKLFNTKETLF